MYLDQQQYPSVSSSSSMALYLTFATPATNANQSTEISPKIVTKEIMGFYTQYPVDESLEGKKKYVMKFSDFLRRGDVRVHLDGMHVITILFQSARIKKLAKNVLPIPLMINVLKSWDREWTERDISTFVYGKLLLLS
jgi:hypothetical protein